MGHSMLNIFNTESQYIQIVDGYFEFILKLEGTI